MTANLELEIAALREAVVHLAKKHGDRLTSEDMCNRLGISYSTLKARVKNRQVPHPSDHGKWMLSDVMVWEERQSKQAA